ncbi:MAG: MFS transporter [Nitrososphaeraceae archaeon]
MLILFLHTSLSPAIPTIAKEFEVNDSLASWVMSVYMISGAVMTILIGKFSDVFGAKKMLILMMSAFAITTALAGFAQDIVTLLIIRAIQGIAIANSPIGLKVIRDQYPKEKFSVGQGILTTAYSGGMAIGVVLGPVLVSELGWQTIFYMCTPIAFLLLFLVWKGIPVDESAKIEQVKVKDKGQVSPPKKTRHKLSIDIQGIITMAIALVSFLLAITYIDSINTNTGAFIVPLVIGIVALLLFIRVEKKAENPLVPLKLLLHPVIFIGNITMLMIGVIQYIVVTGIPQLGASPPGSGLGLSPEAVGLLQLPLSITLMILGPIFGLLLARRKGLNLKLLLPGMTMLCFSFLMLTLFTSSKSGVTAALFVFGIGASLLPISLTNITIKLTPTEFTGIASAATSDMRIIGGAIGPVITMVILSSFLIPLNVDGTSGDYASPTAFEIVFLVGLALSLACTILVMIMRKLAVKSFENQQIS